MSERCDSSAMLGYWFDTDVFNQNFMKKRSEQSHMEERYCSRTGKRLPDVKMIDVHEANYYFFNNNYFAEHDVYDFYDAVAEELKKHKLTISFHQGDSGEILGAVVGICITGLTVKSVLAKEKRIKSASKAIKKICKVGALPPLKVHPITTVYH